MKTLLTVLAAASLLAAAPQSHLYGADEGSIKAEMEKNVVPKIQAKVKAEKRAEADYADELKAIDALLAAHKDEKTDEVAGLLIFKAQIYAQLFENSEKAIGFLKQLKTDFAGTDAAKAADQFIGMLEQQAAAEKAQAAFKPGNPFPDFSETDINGKPLSVSAYKGKVVLVDFWATWCGPCVAELPNVLKAYEKYHDKGFEIIGISLDQEKSKLTDFIEKKKMPWQQFFDGAGWQNKLAQKYGINSIPATFLLDKEGKIIARGLRGAALDKAVAKALGLEEAAAPAQGAK